MSLPYSLAPADPAPLGLIVLQSDETIEMELRRILPPGQPLFVSRIASDVEVTSATLAAMKSRITDVARLFPEGRRLAAVGYGCTSATAEIGADAVAALVQAGCECDAVTEPVSALMMGMGLVALFANSVCLVLISKHREGEVHMRSVLTTRRAS